MKLLPLTTAVGGSVQVQQRVHRGLARLVALRAALGDAAPGRTRARRLERQPVAAHALVGRGEPGDADRHRDPAVPEVDQVLDEPRGRLLVVAADLVERDVDEAVEQHDRHALRLPGTAARARSAPTDGASSSPSTWRSASVRTIRSSCSGSSRVSPSSSVWPARPAAASTAATTSMKYGFESPLIASPSDCVPPRASARAIVFGPVARALDRREHAAARPLARRAACR